MIKPFFSIVTCSYNSDKTLDKTIDSVLNQTFNDYEHIFIDGNSTDKTSKILERYKNNNSGKVKIFNLPPKGISNAMNEGIKRAQGKYLIFLHSDDSFYSPDVLQKAHDFLVSSPNLDWVYGKINVINEKGQNRGVFPTRKIFQTSSKTLLKFFNYIPHQAVFMKREIFDKFGLFDENLKYSMDYEYWLRLAQGTGYKFINLTISNYLSSPKTLSGNPNHQSNIAAERHYAKKRYLNKIELFAADFIDSATDKIARRKLWN